MGLQPRLGIPSGWLLMAFLSGLAVAVITENLILEAHDHRLEFSAPRTDFFQGQPLARLRNAEEVPFVIRTTLFSGTKAHVFSSATDRFLVSYDIFADDPLKAFSVARATAPGKKASRLSAKDAQAWCLKQMSLDITGLGGTETLWARLDIVAEDPPREGSILGSSVSSSGISLINPLIDLLSRTPGGQPQWHLDYDAFTLDQLKHTRGS